MPILVTLLVSNKGVPSDFAGIQYIFLSPKMLDIVKWDDNDPRIHKNANCRYRDRRTALEFIVEMAKNNMIICDYLERRKHGN